MEENNLEPWSLAEAATPSGNLQDSAGHYAVAYAWALEYVEILETSKNLNEAACVRSWLS